MKHLSDEDMQLYIRGAGAEKTEYLETHLRDCADCRRQLAVYKNIDTALGTSADGGFGNDFDQAVMNGIHEYAKKPARSLDYAVMGLGLSGIVALALFLILYGPAREILAQGYHYFMESAGSYSEAYGKFSEWLKFAPAALTILICYGILDRLLVRARKLEGNHLIL